MNGNSGSVLRRRPTPGFWVYKCYHNGKLVYERYVYAGNKAEAIDKGEQWMSLSLAHDQQVNYDKKTAHKSSKQDITTDEWFGKGTFYENQ
jgi:hypothetical protein